MQLPVHQQSPALAPPPAPLGAAPRRAGPLPSSMPRSCARECGCAQRAAMQERPAVGGRRAISASPTIATHAASQIFRTRVVMGHLTCSVTLYTIPSSRTILRTIRGVRSLNLIGVWYFQVTRVRRACRWCASRSVSRLGGIPVSIMCVSDACRPDQSRVLCNASNKTSASVSSHMYIKTNKTLTFKLMVVLLIRI